MTVTQALATFSRFGIDVAGMTSDQLRKARNKLVMADHPDHGGTAEALTAINDAYDFLKRNGTVASREKSIDLSNQSHQSYSRDSHASGRMPAWALAGYSGGSLLNTAIYRNDFSDANFFKKAMWELSGKSTTAYTVWGFDGPFLQQFDNGFRLTKNFRYHGRCDGNLAIQQRKSPPDPRRPGLPAPRASALPDLCRWNLLR